MELNQKLALWAGFRQLPKGNKGFHYERTVKIMDWMSPNETALFMGRRSVPNFSDSLDDCFEWLVPEKLSEVTFMYASNCVSCDIEDLDGNFFEGHVDVESIEEAWTKSALALCLAVEKLIDGS